MINHLIPVLIFLLISALSACNASETPTSLRIAPGKSLVSATRLNPYQVFELAIGASHSFHNPYTHGAQLQAVFRGIAGEAVRKRIEVYGFWDGENVWRLRFAPTTSGIWEYRTSSDDDAMNGLQGSLSVVPASKLERKQNPLLGGFLVPCGNAWQLSDGTSFFPVGDSQWSLLEEYTVDEIKAWLDALHTLGLTTLHGTVWLGIYTRANNSPFKDRDPKTDQLDPEYFQKLDEVVRYANQKGIILGLAIGGFPGNSRWYDLFGDRERHDRWFRYIVDRYSAFNVRWILFGEINEVDPPWGGGWQRTGQYYAALVKERDPYNHPIGSHHTLVDEANANDPNIDYIEVQIPFDEHQYKKAQEYYLRWNKPLWFEEYWYEPSSYHGHVELGMRNTHRNFISALAFPTIGSLMRAHSKHWDFPPRWATLWQTNLKDYLLDNDTGLQRLSEFKAFYQKLNLFQFQPWTTGCDRPFCARFGDDYALFLYNGGKIQVDLRNDQDIFQVIGLQIHTGKQIELGQLDGGKLQHIDLKSRQDTAILLLRQKEIDHTNNPVISPLCMPSTSSQ